MKITNNHGLPEPLVRAVSFDDYQRGNADFTVTELVKPPRIAALERLHKDELTEDTSERLWLLMGKAGHEVLRRSSQGGIVEERCEVEIEGVKISGQMDYAVQDCAIYDYKFTSVWAVKDGVKPEWEAQLNCYKWMAEQYGVAVKHLTIVAIMRDWSIGESQRDPSYPQCQVTVLQVPLWTKEQVEVWVKGRISLHENARQGNLPECTAEEMWEKPPKFAVKKKGNQRATKLHDTLDAARLHAFELGIAYEVETRKVQRPRCEIYCPVSEHCQQFKEWKGQQ